MEWATTGIWVIVCIELVRLVLAVNSALIIRNLRT